MALETLTDYHQKRTAHIIGTIPKAAKCMPGVNQAIELVKEQAKIMGIMAARIDAIEQTRGGIYGEGE